MEKITTYLEVEQTCVQLVAQFLLYNDFTSTLPFFIEEAISLNYSLNEEELNRVDHIKRKDIHKLISAFQSSDYINFFKEWDELVPSIIKQTYDYKKLTFYLHVHFAVIPFRNKQAAIVMDKKSEQTEKELIKINNTKVERISRDVNSLEVIEEYDTDSLDQSRVVMEGELSEVEEEVKQPPETAMDLLKSFLVSEGEFYSSQQELLPFFALPYVSNLNEHPSFTSLFQDDWLRLLQDKLYTFIHRYSCDAQVAPKLTKICEIQLGEKENVDKSNSNAVPMSSTADLVRRYKHVRRKFNKLHRDHQNLIGVAAELTAALENSVRGQAVDLRATLNNCAVIFPELFGTGTTSAKMLEVSTLEPLRDSKVLCCSELDVFKIKSHLLTASIKTKLLLLQAIRWRITKGTSEERDQAIAWLTRHDVLSLHSDLVKSMLEPANATTPHPLQQTLSRLLNAVASVRSGRDYLASSDSLLTQLVMSLKQESYIRLDNITSDMLLATLQKLSLRRNPRLLMIGSDMVEWLVARLSGECERLYALEYSTALLLNLCLHVEARERCPSSTLKLLTDLLDTGQRQIVPMVAGSLYCLLSHERLNQTAREMNLESILTSQMERYTEEPQILRQIQTLLRLLRGELPTKSVLTVSEEPSEDDLDDPDNLEAELDADDPVKSISDDQFGEALLQIQYRRIFPSHGVVCPNRSEPEISILPSTPRSRPPTREKLINA